MAQTAPRPPKRHDWLRDDLPKLVLSPSFAIVLVFVYGFILFTLYLSFTDSRDPAVVRLGRAGRTTSGCSRCAPGASRSTTC